MLLALVALLPIRDVNLVAVGDVMLGRWVGRRIKREGVDSPFRSVAPLLRNADLAVGNLECALTGAHFTVEKRFLLRASPAVAPALKRAGFGLLSLANNHSEDCGARGVKDSQRWLSAARIEPLGPSDQPVIVNRNGLRIGFMGLRDLPGFPRAKDAQVAALRKQVDVLVVMIHWGIEESPRESPAQRKLAKKLAADGVDLILGSHPHVLQPIRWENHCLVAYSLGNFIFDARPGKERESEILSVKLGPHGVETYSTTPVSIVRGYPELQQKK